jgi:hypothetical protein
MHCLASIPGAAEVGARYPASTLYDQRALLMADRGDLVCVTHEVEADYMAFLNTLGAGPDPGDVVAVGAAEDTSRRSGALTERLLADPRPLARLAERLPAGVPVRLEPFIAAPDELEVARRLASLSGRDVSLLGDPAAAARANRKDLLRRWAVELGVPLPEGEVVTLAPDPSGRPATVAPLREAIERRLRAGAERVLVRGSDGASGSATRIVKGSAEAVAATLAWAAGRQGGTAYLVDRFHDVLVSPNILTFVPPDPRQRVRFVAATDQILGADLRHIGNAFPSRAVLLEKMIRHALRLSRHLRREGYVGWAGFDFCEHVDPTTGARRVFLAELNARVNGACYPVSFATKWTTRSGKPFAFVSGHLRTAARSFRDLAARHRRLLLWPGSHAGAVPYNTGCLAHGYCSAVVLDETPDTAWRRWRELATAFGG